MLQPSNNDFEAALALAESAASSTDEALVHSEFVANVETIRRTSSQEEHQLVRNILTKLLKRKRPAIESIPYPLSVKSLMDKEFNRIEASLAKQPDNYFAMSNHGCRCDLRILAFGRIPVGPEHLEIDGLPRSISWKRGIGQAFRALSLFLRTGGFKPFYVIHLGYGYDPATFLFHYSKRAQRKMFLNIADCMKLNPEIKGVLAGSWWHDPQLDVVAPHLSYLRTGWTDQGAEILFWESSADIDDVATRNSPDRRAMFDRGEYTPKCYMVIWPRKSLLNWAAETQTT